MAAHELIAMPKLRAAYNSVVPPDGYTTFVINWYMSIHVQRVTKEGAIYLVADIKWTWDYEFDRPLWRCSTQQGQYLQKVSPDLNELVHWACTIDRLNIGK